MTEITERYHFFWSGPFSQWHRSRFTHAGEDFDTAEQAMMWEKARLFGDSQAAAAILAEPEPGRQKALGRKVQNFDEAVWSENKVRIVTEVSRSKYLQNKGLRRKLFQTIPKQLVEASPVDTVWGIGLDERQAAETPADLWPGQNLLGQILTDVRQKLAEEFPQEARACSHDQEAAQ